MMGKVDCVMEAIENGKRDTSIDIAISLLEIGKLSLEEISKTTGVSLEKIKELKSSL